MVLLQKSSLLAKVLIDEPQVLLDINTEYGLGNRLCSVSSLSDSELWNCGWDELIRLYNLQGELLKSVQT